MLAYKKSGSGPPVVYLHGLFGDKDNLAFFSRKLPGFAHILMDLPCHGDSPNPTTLDYPAMAKMVLETVSEITQEPFTIVGHSLGGRVGMECALAQPSMLSGLVILDIGPLGGPPRHEEIFKAILDLSTGAKIKKEMALAELKKRLQEPMILQFIGKSLKEDPVKGTYWNYGLQGLKDSWLVLWESLDTKRRFDKKVLLLMGESSDYVDSKSFEEMSLMFPNLEDFTISSAGHWIHAENPRAVLEKLKTFLTEP